MKKNKIYKSDINDLDLKELIDDYIKRLKSPTSQRLFKITLYKILKLKTINEVEINNFLINLNMADTSKRTVRNVIISFLNWLNRTQSINFDTKEIQKFKYHPRLKTIYSEKEKEIIFQYLKDFNYPKFELYFHIIAWNGCRLSESTSVDLEELYMKERVRIKTVKGGRFRIILANNVIMNLLTRVNLNSWTPQTLTNYFCRFKEYVKERDPKWMLDIKASQLRTQFITDLSRNRLTSSEIQILTGHVNTSVIENTYIRADEVQMEKVFRRGKMSPIDSIKLSQIELTFNNLNEKIHVLESELEAERERIISVRKNSILEFLQNVKMVYGNLTYKELMKIYEQMFFNNIDEKTKSKFKSDFFTSGMFLIENDKKNDK